MKKIAIITPVPDVIKTLIENSIIRKSIDNEVAQIEVINLRDHGVGNYRQVDDSPFGGGGGFQLPCDDQGDEPRWPMACTRLNTLEILWMENGVRPSPAQ